MSGRFIVTAASTYPDHYAACASLYGVQIVTDEADLPHLIADRIRGELYPGFAEIDPLVPDNVIPDLRPLSTKTGLPTGERSTRIRGMASAFRSGPYTKKMRRRMCGKKCSRCMTAYCM